MSADLWKAFGSGPPPSLSSEDHRQSNNVCPAQSPAPSGLGGPTSTFTTDERLWKTDTEGADVLFDASDDEFGDFEDVEPRTATLTLPASSTKNVDLLGLGNFESTHEKTTQDLLKIESTPAEQMNHFRSIRGTDMVQTTQTLEMPSQEANDADEWGGFENASLEAPISTSHADERHQTLNKPKTSHSSMDDNWGMIDDTSNTNASEISSHGDSPANQDPRQPSPLEVRIISLHHDRPTNIPPPFTLLQLIPQIYQTLSSPAKLTQSQVETAELARSIIGMYSVTARVIAGRSHRWKRDVHLAQSMRISQAGVKSSGMKLTALDRGEAIKENQEVLEVINAWSRHAHRMNAILARAKLKKPPMSFSSNMNVRAANGAGVLTAKDVCPVCGLKRVERVLGIDVNVEDAFDEFWVEHWGHRACHDFWYTYESMLNQR